MKPIRTARRLRRNMTDAERRLWSRLRSKQLGAKFRRQVPIDRFVTDFARIEARLVIEVDGGQHNVELIRDQMRSAILESAGYLVMRFWNQDVLTNTDGVVEEIAAMLAPRPADHT